MAPRKMTAMLYPRLLASLATLTLMTTWLSCAKTVGGDEDGEGGSGASSSNDSCEAFEDAVGDIVLVKFHNKNQSGPIYIPTPCNVPGRPFFVLERGAEVQIDKPECSAACGVAQTDAAYYCPDYCAELGNVVRIDPGYTYEFEWHATEQVQEPMPVSCYHDEHPTENQCSRTIDLTEGQTSAIAYYFTGMDFSGGQTGCDCVLPMAEGVCHVGMNCTATGSYRETLPLGVYLPDDGVIAFEI